MGRVLGLQGGSTNNCVIVVRVIIRGGMCAWVKRDFWEASDYRRGFSEGEMGHCNVIYLNLSLFFFSWQELMPHRFGESTRFLFLFLSS